MSSPGSLHQGVEAQRDLEAPFAADGDGFEYHRAVARLQNPGLPSAPSRTVAHAVSMTLILI